MTWLKRLIVGFLVVFVAVPAGFRMAAMLRESESMTEALPNEGRLIDTRMGQIFLLEYGPENGPVLLFAHGTAAWSGLWRPTLEAAAAEGYRAIAFDMPPFGYSERTDSAEYSRVTQALRAVALIRALDIDPIVIAHSFGAGAMVEAAMRYPQHVSALVVVDGALGLGSHETGGAMPLPLRPNLFRETAVSLSVTNPLAMRAMLRSMIHIDAAATPEVADLLRQPMRRSGTTAAYSDWVPSLLVPPQDALSTQAEAYGDLSIPVAYIWGAEDTVTPIDQGRALVALTPDATLIEIAEVGHIPQLENPGAFQEVLFETIRSITSETR